KEWVSHEWSRWLNPEPDLELRVFGNGNGHLHFSPVMLRAVNLALSEFYGDVLPDENGGESTGSREVSKDLQYYPTPRSVTDRVLGNISIKSNCKILEPSCGDGRILDAISEAWPEANTLGIEVHGGRAEEARSKGHNVYTGNFLEVTPSADFDLVVMN